jgi:bifunctional DNase/RNase
MQVNWTRTIIGGAVCMLIVIGSTMLGQSQSTTQVEIREVEVRLSDHGPVVLLKVENRVIPIFVDSTVAGSIQAALTGQKLSRPLSHDLMRTILDSFGGKVTQTVITLKDGIFRGSLTVVMNDKTKVFDGRSSDAIALAVQFKAPIVVGRDLLDSTGKTMPDSKTMVL